MPYKQTSTSRFCWWIASGRPRLGLGEQSQFLANALTCKAVERVSQARGTRSGTQHRSSGRSRKCSRGHNSERSRGQSRRHSRGCGRECSRKCSRKCSRERSRKRSSKCSKERSRERCKEHSREPIPSQVKLYLASKMVPMIENGKVFALSFTRPAADSIMSFLPREKRSSMPSSTSVAQLKVDQEDLPSHHPCGTNAKPDSVSSDKGCGDGLQMPCLERTQMNISRRQTNLSPRLSKLTNIQPFCFSEDDGTHYPAQGKLHVQSNTDGMRKEGSSLFPLPCQISITTHSTTDA